jgi:hypothetical protein
MQSEVKWTLKDVKKKIENLEIRLLKAKRLQKACIKPTEELFEKREGNESKTSILSHSPSKHQKLYYSLCKKFIIFSNSIWILMIQHGLKQETYNLLK